jgi:PAS domain S-box-containing protein
MTTSRPLRILHIEDDLHDRELAAATLAADGITHEMVYADSKATFETALLTGTFDVILADYSLPGFDGLTALGIAKRCAPRTPFVFLSGTLGEELAIEILKEGATDYVLKPRIARLSAAVRRAIRETAERGERERAEAEVRRLNAELEARVEERTAALAAAHDRLAANERQRRDSEQLLQAILDHSPIAILVKDLQGRFVLANEGAGRFFQRPVGEIVGRKAAEVAPPRFAEIYDAHDREALASGDAMQWEEPFVIGDRLGVRASTRFPLRTPDGAIYAICCISEDVTERKQNEDELRLAKIEAQRASMAKNEFLAHMSHDLRTPLNAILGFAQLLELEDLKADGIEGVRHILYAGRHLLDLINGVLDITRIEAGHMSLSVEPVLVCDVLERATGLVNPMAAERGIEIDIQQPAADEAVSADRQRLSQVLINLLSNAVKYNREGGRVTVRYETAGPAGRPRISIDDTGLGIPAEKLRLLFQPFERLGAERSTVEGTGLGLSLSRSLAEAMGGRLGVDSIVDRGSTFWLELPAAKAPARVARRTFGASAPSAGRGLVLYVEDNPANVRLMRRIVQQMSGVTLMHAGSGAEAIERARAERPDAVLLDLHLPDMAGDEVLRRLTSDPLTRGIPKVVVTADATPGLSRALKASGAVAFLTKPLDIRDVQRLLSDVLSQREDFTDERYQQGA